MEERVATQHVLSKHHLLRGFHSERVLQTVNDIVALHATVAATPYLSLLARVKGFQRNHLDEELYVKRNLIRLEAMRGTLFIASAEIAPTLYQATKTSEFQRFKRLQRWGMSKSEYDELAEAVCNVLKGGGKTLAEIRKALPKEMIRSLQLRVGKETYKGTNVNLALSTMMRKGVVVSEKGPEIVSTIRANRYTLFHQAYPNLNLESRGSEEARTILIQRYIGAFGPVTKEDIAWWTGFNNTETNKVLTAIDNELVSVKIAGLNRDYLMLKNDYERCLRFKPPKPNVLGLLPYEDPYTKGYKIRDRLIDKEHEKKAYPGGAVQPTILIDGKITGTWTRSIGEQKEPTKLRFFKQPPKHAEREAIRKAKAATRLLIDKDMPIEVEAES